MEEVWAQKQELKSSFKIRGPLNTGKKKKVSPYFLNQTARFKYEVAVTTLFPICTTYHRCPEKWTIASDLQDTEGWSGLQVPA